MSMSYLELEDAVLALLEPLVDALSLRTLASYGGEFSPDSIGQVTVLYPAVYVYLANLESSGHNRLDDRKLTLSVYVAAQNLRGEESARRGSGSAIGVYGLLEAVREKLNLAPLNSGLLRLKREAVVGYSAQNGLCVAQADYGLEFQLTRNFAR